MEREQFARRIRSLRQRAELTQTQVAERTGTTRRRIADWESGTRIPAGVHWAELAQALEVPLDALLAPEGWQVLPVPWLRPETVALMQGSSAGFEQVYELVCRRIRAAMEEVRPLPEPTPGRRRRSREDVLLKGHKPPRKRPAGGG